jgi:quercetin dioxygenase-like cupin family protein
MTQTRHAERSEAAGAGYCHAERSEAAGLRSIALLCLALAACGTAPPAPPGGDAAVRSVLTQTLPAMDGAKLHVTVVEVSYAPGGSSKPHSHPCPVIGYVLDGSLRSGVRGGADSVYHAGETFYEEPNGVHAVSANASGTEPVRFLAYFICDRDAPLSRSINDTTP